METAISRLRTQTKHPSRAFSLELRFRLWLLAHQWQVWTSLLILLMAADIFISIEGLTTASSLTVEGNGAAASLGVYRLSALKLLAAVAIPTYSYFRSRSIGVVRLCCLLMSWVLIWDISTFCNTRVLVRVLEILTGSS